MSCPLCQNDKGSLVYKKLLNLTRCDRCGFAYVLGQYSKELYNQDYFTKSGDLTGRDFLGEWSRLYDEARFPQEIRRIKRFKKKGNLLDIGCAMGSFMELAHKEGFAPYGTDVSPFAIEHIRNTYGFPAFVGFLSDIKFDREMFDVITMHHVLEHIPDPIHFLSQEIRPLLKKDGLLVVEVPNFGSFESRINGEAWEDLKPWEHLNQFTPKTLRRCLQKTGFRVEAMITYTPYAYRPLWRYPRLLSLVGLPECFIQRVGRWMRSGAKDEHPEEGVGADGKGVRAPSWGDDLSRWVALPLIFLYAKLRLEKYLAVYARPQ